MHYLQMAKNDRTIIPFDDADFPAGERAAPEHYLQAWRKKRKLTQGQLGEMVGMSTPLISEIETESKNLSVKWLWKFAEALKVPPGYILQYHPDQVPTDFVELWNKIPEDKRILASETLKVFSSKDGTNG